VSVNQSKRPSHMDTDLADDADRQTFNEHKKRFSEFLETDVRDFPLK